MKHWQVITIIIVLCLGYVLYKSPDGLIADNTKYGSFPGDRWGLIPDPAALGWNKTDLNKARAYAEVIGSDAVMLVEDGVVIASWGDITADYNANSVRKSLLSGLMGIQVAKGNINLDKTLSELGIDDLDPLSSDEKQATIRHLIQARSGVYHPALGETREMRASKPKRHSHKPGQNWYYNNWDFNTLGSIFRRETGRNIFAAFQHDIARPLGMQDFDPDRCFYKKQEDTKYWGGEAARSIHPYWGMRISCRDLARYGLLFLRGGKWAGKQIIPAKWIAESTGSHSRTGKPNGGYGYMWWTGRGKLPGWDLDLGGPCYWASGWRAQRLLIIPHRKLLFVHRTDSSKSKNSITNRQLGNLLWLIIKADSKHPAPKKLLYGDAPGIDITQPEQISGIENLVPISNNEIKLQVRGDGGFRVMSRKDDRELLSGSWKFRDGRFHLTLPHGEEVLRLKRHGERILVFDEFGFLVRTYIVIPDN